MTNFKITTLIFHCVRIPGKRDLTSLKVKTIFLFTVLIRKLHGSLNVCFVFQVYYSDLLALHTK